MLLTEYLSELTNGIGEYAKTGLILSSELTIDSRTEKTGLIKGAILFINESKLFFTEYLDLRYKTQKLSYVFHYQEKGGRTIFRYDNASHRPALSFADHKHVGEDVVRADVPGLNLVLEEIIQCLLQKGQV
jgi:hypothetical protein